MSKHCPKCHKSFSDEFDECVYCGSELSDGDYIVYYDNNDIKSNSTKNVFLKVVYYDLENNPQSAELLCSNCKNIFEIDEDLDDIFEEITSEHLIIKNGKEITCTCGNKHPLKEITFQNVKSNVSVQPVRMEPTTKSSTEAYIPKCPTCGSPKIQKVSAISKAGSVFMWGLLSQKVKKTWHCNNCSYEW